MFEFIIASCFLTTPDGVEIELDFCGQETEEVQPAPENYPTQNTQNEMIFFTFSGYTEQEEAYTLLVLVEHRPSLINQKWVAGDFLIAILTTRNYEAEYIGQCEHCVVETDSTGKLKRVYFALKSYTNKDSLNGGLVPYIDANGYHDSRGRSYTWDKRMSPNQSLELWKFRYYYQ